MSETIWDERTASFRGLSSDATVDSSKLKPFGQAVDDAIRLHAVEAFPNECCGLVVGGEYVRAENKAEKPTNNAVVDPDLIEEIGPDNIQAVAHSHPFVQPWPSAKDMQQQMLWDVPWAIASVHKGPMADDQPICVDLFWYGDSLPDLPLLNRFFRHGVQDCYALVRSFFRQNDGVIIPNFARDPGWWLQKPDGIHHRSLFTEKLPESGFRRIDSSELRPGDCLIAPNGTTSPSHCGVLLESEMLLHHLPNQLSKTEPAYRWVKRAKDGGAFYRRVEE